jgi:hypothetical protein
MPRRGWRCIIRALAALIVACAGLLNAPTSANAAREFVVQPYYVYPHDQPYHAEYARAIRKLAHEVQQWYADRVGMRFHLASLKVVRAPDDYLTMRCGFFPSDECRANRQDLSQWLQGVNRAVAFTAHQSNWIFAQGGGGFAGANLYFDFNTYAIVGDWTLEPISGVAEPAAITCAFATWQCQGGVPKGAAAHELGHTFGLHHPPPWVPGMSLMRWHGDYPDTSLLAHEVMILRESPFFNDHAFDASGPFLYYGYTPAEPGCGQLLSLVGQRFVPSEATIEFRDVAHSVVVAPEGGYEGGLSVRVPAGMQPGYLRVWQNGLRSNVLPMNFAPC